MQSVFACFPKKESTLCIIITTGHLFFLALDVLLAPTAVPLEGPAPFKVKTVRGPLSCFSREEAQAPQKLVKGCWLVGSASPIPGSVVLFEAECMDGAWTFMETDLPSLPFMNQLCLRLFHSSILSSCTIHPLMPVQGRVENRRIG